MSTKNKKIIYGKLDLPDEEFESKNVKERITIFIDQDVLNQFRARAKKEKAKYQTLINQCLREAALKPALEDRVEALELAIRKRA